MKPLLFLAQAAAKIKNNEVNLPIVPADELLANTLNAFYFIVGTVALIVIILSGFTFTTAVYDQAKIAQAKNAILYAVVGLIVIIMAFVITQFILGRF